MRHPIGSQSLTISPKDPLRNGEGHRMIRKCPICYWEIDPSSEERKGDIQDENVEAGAARDSDHRDSAGTIKSEAVDSMTRNSE
jgi:hypothetical protein